MFRIDAIANQNLWEKVDASMNLNFGKDVYARASAPRRVAAPSGNSIRYISMTRTILKLWHGLYGNRSYMPTSSSSEHVISPVASCTRYVPIHSPEVTRRTITR
ncbi:hypothetical protein M8818_005154 [Zalaria obscura]|uniref:Uncharacterized protein n=1 Tax=Zalaria obscura TaxID=2024903 RepID=A0ACC3SDZ3_9PEZI